MNCASIECKTENNEKRSNIKTWRATNPRGRSQYGPGSNLYAARQPSMGIIQNNIKFHENAIQNNNKSIEFRRNKLHQLEKLIHFLKKAYEIPKKMLPTKNRIKQLRNSIPNIPKENVLPSPVAYRKRKRNENKNEQEKKLSITPRLKNRVARLTNNDVYLGYFISGDNNFAFINQLHKLVELGLGNKNYNRLLEAGPSGASNVIPEQIKRLSWGLPAGNRNETR